MKGNVFGLKGILVLRIACAGAFIAIGSIQLFDPYGNVFLLIRGFPFMPVVSERFVLSGMPKVQVILGVLLMVGVWSRWMLRLLSSFAFLSLFLIFFQLIYPVAINDCDCAQDSLLPMETMAVVYLILLMLSVFLLTVIHTGTPQLSLKELKQRLCRLFKK